MTPLAASHALSALHLPATVVRPGGGRVRVVPVVGSDTSPLAALGTPAAPTDRVLVVWVLDDDNAWRVLTALFDQPGVHPGLPVAARTVFHVRDGRDTPPWASRKAARVTCAARRGHWVTATTCGPGSRVPPPGLYLPQGGAVLRTAVEQTLAGVKVSLAVAGRAAGTWAVRPVIEALPSGDGVRLLTLAPAPLDPGDIAAWANGGDPRFACLHPVFPAPALVVDTLTEEEAAAHPGTVRAVRATDGEWVESDIDTVWSAEDACRCQWCRPRVRAGLAPRHRYVAYVAEEAQLATLLTDVRPQAVRDREAAVGLVRSAGTWDTPADLGRLSDDAVRQLHGLVLRDALPSVL